MKWMVLGKTSDRNCLRPSLGSHCLPSVVVVGLELEAAHGRRKNGAATFCSVMFTCNINDIPSKIFMTYLNYYKYGLLEVGLTQEEELQTERKFFIFKSGYENIWKAAADHWLWLKSFPKCRTEEPIWWLVTCLSAGSCMWVICPHG